MIYLYDALLLALFVPALILVAFRYRRRLAREFLFKAGERFGIWNTPVAGETGKPLIWVHCASLGEVKAVETVLRKLTGFTILLTTITLSGRKYAEDSRIAKYVFFVPFDFSFLVSKAFKRAGAVALVLVETELWPGLISGARRNGARIFLVNARLSARSFPKYKLLGAFWRPVLRRIDRLCARSAEDAERFLKMGFPADRIAVTGNVKYDAAAELPAVSRQELGFGADDVIWVCGSTRKGENKIIIEAWLGLQKSMPSLKLVLAPRHLNRTKDITGELSRSGSKFSLRSNGGDGSAGCLVLDTFGELWKFYAVCDAAFVGGSLVDMGGQNPIEPASFSKPVIFGPHMENFLTESGALLKSGGGFEVVDGKGLADTVMKLALDSAFKTQAGKNAYNAVQGQRGAVDRTVEIIRAELAAIK